MKERPILFSGAMVRALFAGTKTQTRRVVKPQPSTVRDGEPVWPADKRTLRMRFEACPYGEPGDRLWVRETWRVRVPDQDGRVLDYRADHTSEDPCDEPWSPSIFMPRSASRITLEITDVRIERLQDITSADAIAEGIETAGEEWRHYLDPKGDCLTPRNSYRTLWMSINGPGSWADNPWVWCLTFRRV